MTSRQVTIRRVDITPRQREMLHLVKNGFTYADVASYLGVSEQRVKSQMLDMRNRLDCATTAQAVWKMRHTLEDDLRGRQ